MSKEITPKTPPKKGTRWIETCPRWSGGNRTIRVMCNPVEGYIMVRFSGCSPFLVHVNEFHKRFHAAEDAK